MTHQSPGRTDPAPTEPAAHPRSQPPTSVAAHRPMGLMAWFVPLLVLAVVCLAGWRVLDGTEDHAFNSSGTAPDTVQLTRGETYVLASSGGVAGLAARGITLSTQCGILTTGSKVAALAVTPYTDGTRAVNGIGTFVAPGSGAARILCTSISPVWVEDLPSSGIDFAGLLLLLGVGFALAALVIRLQAGYWAGGPTQATTGRSATSDGDEVQAGVGAAGADPVGADDEVGGGDGGDVVR